MRIVDRKNPAPKALKPGLKGLSAFEELSQGIFQ
jgi:hypothetical protein